MDASRRPAPTFRSAGSRAAQDTVREPDLDFLAPAAADELSIAMSGDSILYRPLDRLEGPRFEGLFRIQRELSDVAITNCEVVFSRSGYPLTEKSDIARVPPDIADWFVWQGVDMVSTGNNHTMDLGPEGLRETLAALDERGIVHSGAGENLDDATRPAVLERKGLRVGLLSFLASGPVGYAAGEDTAGVAHIPGHRVRLPSPERPERFRAPEEEALRRMEAAIEAARPEADVLVVAFHMHWSAAPLVDGSGRRVRVDRGRRIIARAAIDHGADLVYAHGPHAVDPVEAHAGKLVFYSVGNFIFHIFDDNRPSAERFGSTWPSIAKGIHSFTRRPEVWEGLVPRVVVGDDGVRRVQVIPIAIDRSGNPRLCSPERGTQILEDLEAMSEGGGVDFEIEGTHAELAAG